MDLRKRLLNNEETTMEEFPPLPEEELAQSSSEPELEEVPVQLLGNIKARAPEEQLRLDINARNKLGDEMLAKRRELEESGAQELTELEDSQFGNNGLARGLMGAGESLSKTLGAINNADVTGAVSGFRSGIAGLDKSEQDAMRRRNFLKDRLTRADRPFRTLEDADIMKQRGATNIQAQAEAPIEFGEKAIKGDLLKKKTSAGSEVSEASRRSRAIQLRQEARVAQQNKDPEMAKMLIEEAKKYESGNLSNAELSMIDDLAVDREADNSLAWAELALKRKQLADKGTKLLPLSEKTALGLADQGALVGTLNQLESLKANVDTGPVAGRIAALKEATGFLGGDMKELKQLTGTTLANYMKSISGAAISEQESQRLTKLLPSINMNDSEFMTSLTTFRRELARSHLEHVRALEKTGRDVQPFKDSELYQWALSIVENPSTSSKSGGRVKLNSANELPDL